MRTIVYGAVVTVSALFGGLLIGFVVGDVFFEMMPGHDLQNINSIYVVLAAIPALIGLLVGSAIWGVLMGRLAHADDRRSLAWAGALGFAPITLTLVITLRVVEPIAVERFGAVLPLHRLFTLLFVPTAFLIAGVSAWAIGMGLHDHALAKSLMWRVGLVAAITFLMINLGMESAGWVVGAPQAAERLTMLTVLFVGNLGVAMTGGAVMGHALSRQNVG